MSCPKCNSTKISSKGNYRNNRKRWKCENCNHIFIIRTKNYRNKIPFIIRQEILKLTKQKKPFVNKYDCFRKTTYSTREIAKMLNISKSAVYTIIKNGQ